MFCVFLENITGLFVFYAVNVHCEPAIIAIGEYSQNLSDKSLCVTLWEIRINGLTIMLADFFKELPTD